MKALVIGAGIGGLAAGIALRRNGVDVHVYERASGLAEVGAGISLWANALHALDRIGLGAEVRKLGAAYEVAGLRTWDGDLLVKMSAADIERRFGVATIVIHRAELLDVLRGAFGTDALHLGKALTGLKQDGRQVAAMFSDGSQARADALIGADGLHSAVRAAIHGEELPRYAGCTAWRAVVPFTREPVRASESWGYGSVFGQVPMSGGRVYWYATRNGSAGGRNDDEKSALLRLFGGWHAPIRSLIEATDASAILRNDIYDRPPLRRWGTGRVTLLGDAAHPMTPYLGQGGCQALEDAVVLADSIAQQGDVEAALRQYETRRIARTRMFVNRSRIAGWIAQLEPPAAVTLRNALLRVVPAHLQSKQLVKMIGYRV